MISWQVMVSVTSISVAIGQAQIGPCEKIGGGSDELSWYQRRIFGSPLFFFPVGSPRVFFWG